MKELEPPIPSWENVSNKPFVLYSLQGLEILSALPKWEVVEFPPGIICKTRSHQCNRLEKTHLSNVSAGSH